MVDKNSLFTRLQLNSALGKMVHDINGKSVNVGTKIELLSISESFLSKLPDDEVIELKSMIGGIFEIYEIDEWGGAWIESSFDHGNGHISSHSLSLNSSEMKVMD